MGDTFCLIDGSAIRSIEIAPGALGASLRAVAHGVADQPPLPEAQHKLSGEAMRPLSPCHLRARAEADALRIEWTGRGHEGFAWTEGMADAQPAQNYRVTIDGLQGSVSIETSDRVLVVPQTQLPQGAGSPLNISVVALGVLGVSREARTTIIH